MPDEPVRFPPFMTIEQAAVIAAVQVSKLSMLALGQCYCDRSEPANNEMETAELRQLQSDIVLLLAHGLMTCHNQKRGNIPTATGQ